MSHIHEPRFYYGLQGLGFHDFLALYHVLHSSHTDLLAICHTKHTHYGACGLQLPLSGAFFQQMSTQFTPLLLSSLCSDATFSVRPTLATLVISAIFPSLFYLSSMLFIAICIISAKCFINCCIVYLPPTRMQVS